MSLPCVVTKSELVGLFIIINYRSGPDGDPRIERVSLGPKMRRSGLLAGICNPHARALDSDMEKVVDVRNEARKTVTMIRTYNHEMLSPAYLLTTKGREAVQVTISLLSLVSEHPETIPNYLRNLPTNK